MELSARTETRHDASMRSKLSAPSKYLGFALLLAWHYCLWFIPGVFPHIELMADSVTTSWLVNLWSTVCSLFLVSALLGRRRHLSDYRWLCRIVPPLTCLGTLSLLLLPLSFEEPWFAYGLALFLGITEALMWILWGERYACSKANFSIQHIGTVFGLTLLVCIALASALPPYFSSVFVALLPIASGVLLRRAMRDNVRTFPTLLPKKTAKGGVKSLGVVCAISSLASIACYFLAAIIPWQLLPTYDGSFTFGILGGALLMLVISGICMASKNRVNIFRLFPWLLVFEVVAFALFLASDALYFPSFVFAVAISSILEILLIMYFGILTTKGFVAPAFAFSCSCGFIRAGIVLGNTLALIYEAHPAFAAAFTPETCLVFICVLMALLIPLVRQEYNIAELTSQPLTVSEIAGICDEIAREFKLSGREAEILRLMANGHTAESAAKKLVISPYTVNTHIRHIYEKMQIHKRSELLNYINMQRSDF